MRAEPTASKATAANVGVQGVLLAVLVLLLSAAPSFAAPGDMLTYRKITEAEGGFTGIIRDRDGFATALTTVGDLDGNGVIDLAVGAYGDTDGGLKGGAVWILFLNADGTVKRHRKISSTDGGFPFELEHYGFFGFSVAGIGDLDGDGVEDIAVGQPQAGGPDLELRHPGYRGAAWIVLLRRNGRVKAAQKISNTDGGFEGNLESEAYFGTSVAAIGDRDGDGVVDLAVGASGANPTVWMLYLNPDGTVKSHRRISDEEHGFCVDSTYHCQFGWSVTSVGDLDGDGVGDLAVGARSDGNAESTGGAVWILFLNADETVKASQKISATEGNFTAPIDVAAHFGQAVSSPGDLDGDGIQELVVGSLMTGHPDDYAGPVFILFLAADGTVKSHVELGPDYEGLAGVVEKRDWFGAGIAALGDLNGDRIGDISVGASGDDDAGQDHGAIYLLLLDGVPSVDDESNDEFDDEFDDESNDEGSDIWY